ncbi:hypothetical protein BDY17DRAFT_145386 [Neohortaea acidophila]|uniref:Gfd2/YDR514C-like C-terminal domain-containing protein n=1 Tax=Neohortaea acidophila TaxID=245834 RepID=A0A6A6PT94_9PEZI|nr:uncharacterized protein BDY17DRAFT_145386 [Neohortaea acidophila]KAF2483319.1 hypothetical protein BDY17DRAFT_145386 [Neohortaea acidophila]
MARRDFKAMTRSLKRCERYLGYRRPNEAGEIRTDPQHPPSSLPEHPVIFVSVDFEADETNQRITEMGITSLDTELLLGVEPGVDGIGWMNLAYSHHYLIAGTDNMLGDYTKRGKFSKSNPGGFIKGKTQERTLDEMRKIVREHFEGPFSSNGVRTAVRNRRELVLVAHGRTNEFKYFEQLDFDPRKHPKVIDIIDTQDLEEALRRDPTRGTAHSQPRRLERIIEETLGGEQRGKHNGGMDAFYTMQALLGLTFRSIQGRVAGSEDEEWGTNDDGGQGVVPRKSTHEYMDYYAKLQ